MGFAASASSGPAQVVNSGILISFKGEPIAIKLSPVGSLEFRFADDPSQPAPRMHGELTPSGSLTIHLSNFNNPVGTGSSEPLSPDRTLHYTIYSVREPAEPELEGKQAKTA
jgi:hypothetical protein